MSRPSIAFFSLFVALFLGNLNQAVLAQEDPNLRSLDHEDYELWTTIDGYGISNDGQWVQFRTTTGKDKTELKFRHTQEKKEYSIPFGSGPRFTDNSQIAIYRVSPDPKVLKKLRKSKTPTSEMPKGHLEILQLATGHLTKISDVRSFQIPSENSEWLATLLNEQQNNKRKDQKATVDDVFRVTEKGLTRKSQAPLKGKGSSAESKRKSPKPSKKPTDGQSKTKDEAKPKLKAKEKKPGYTLVLRNLASGVERRFPNVTSYQFDDEGTLLAFATSVESGEKIQFDPAGDGVSIVDLKSGEVKQLISGNGNYRNLSISDDGKQLAFLSDRNDDAKKPSWSLYYWKRGTQKAAQIAHEGDKGIPEGWWVAGNAGLQFHESGHRLYFGTMPRPETEKEDDEPKANLDLWHWQDPQLQPQQLLRASRERNRTYQAVYDIRSKKIIQLADLDVPSMRIDPKQPSVFLIANSDVRYQKMLSWDNQGYQDIYSIHQKSGERKMLLEKTRVRASLSPTGKFIFGWDSDSRHWIAMPVGSSTPTKISDKVKHPLWNELHDSPSNPRPYGIAGWLKNDSAILVYDRYDIWQLDPLGKKKPICVTNGQGRGNRERLRYVRLNREERHIPTDEKLLLSTFDESTKGSGYSTLRITQAGSEVEELLSLNESLGGITKAENSDHVVFTRSTFRMFPDLWCSDLKFNSVKRLSKANPQQRDYRWGTAELTKWQSTQGQEIEGLLYKPDGFDASKKYPLMVYFYERNSDNLHRHYVPAAGRSIINISFYVSRGYVLFVPDIPYEIGFPGDSAFHSVVPGVKHIVKQGFIDESKIGMQGHSWGGYQTAYLVTKTDMFACAESGAPVSNMTSAYGGIRWGSGMSRMFQYEKTQSRIGATLWEDREKYILNSPVFQADKINTPLLILHNDQDGAVPWYQGIELFVAMRRLEKPAWLMNYNGEPHWVMKDENRLDFAKRMQQFFDHYLMDAPMPEWMASGIPAVDKGKKFGFEPSGSNDRN